MAKTIQDKFNSLSGDLTFISGEYEGPLAINRPCVIDGNLSTLWVNKGPALIINSDNVFIKNLRIDVIDANENYDEQTAVKGNGHKVTFENVKVSGRVTGVGGESAEWQLPGTLQLGDIKAEQENFIDIVLNAAADADIVNNIKCIELSVSKLKKGKNIIRIKTGSIRENTILFGELSIKTRLTRTVYLLGEVKKYPCESSISTAVQNCAGNSLTQINITSANIPYYDISGNISAERFKDTLRGQRALLDNSISLDIEYTQNSGNNLDVDGYVFVLKDDEKVKYEKDFVFFANKKSSDNSVAINDNNSRIIHIELSRVSDYVQKIVVCYSIYEDDQNDFTGIEPEILIYCNANPFYKFKVDNLSFIKTLAAVEIYRSKENWKINFVGSGYKNKLAELCGSYGIEVK